MKQALFFDLDGTLANLQEGICQAYRYALRPLGLSLPSETSPLFGAPVLDTLADVWGLLSSEAHEAERRFWQYYAQKGFCESCVSQAVLRFLQHVSQKHMRLYAFSVLRYGAAEKVLAYHGMKPYVSDIFEAAADGTCSSREDILRAAMEREKLQASELLLLGANRQSADAAKFLGLDFLHADAFDTDWEAMEQKINKAMLR